MDGIIDTVSAVHPLQPLLGLLKSNGKLVMVGAPDKPLELPAFPLLMGIHLSLNQRCYLLLIYSAKKRKNGNPRKETRLGFSIIY